MTILVTGSAGHLGEALMRTLEGGKPLGARHRYQALGFYRHVGSINDRAFVRQAMSGISHVSMPRRCTNRMWRPTAITISSTPISPAP